jgi:hypothetical protein
MKSLIVLLVLVALGYSIQDVPTLNIFQDSAVITATPFNQNFDTLKKSINKALDTIENKFIRFSDLNGGDSTLRVDTVYGRSSVWTGIALIDSLVVTKQIQGNLKGNIVGNVTGNITGNLTGNVTGNISGATGTFSGTVLVDSLKSTKQIEASLKGNVTGNVTGNLTGNVTGNASGTAATVTGAAQTAITSVGTLTGLTVGGTSTFDSTRHRTITTSGSVCIGTTTITEKLDVNGAAIIGDKINTGAAIGGIPINYIKKYVGTSTDAGVLYVPLCHTDITAAPLTGFVGTIYFRRGTASASLASYNARLDVNNAYNEYQVTEFSTNNGGLQIVKATYGGIEYLMLFLSGHSSLDVFIDGSIRGLVPELITAANDGAAGISSVTVYKTPYLVVDADGNLGVGMTPTEKLEVSDNIKADTLKGAVIGNVTGNVSGTAATVTGAAQSAITSVGTLTGLTLSGNITTGTADIITDSVFARTIKTSGSYIVPSMVLTGTSRTFIQTIRDTTIATDATINLFSAASLTSYVGEIEISIGTLRNVKKTFAWYGQDGLAAVDTATIYDLNSAGDGITITLAAASGSPGTLGVSFAGVGASRSVAMYLRYTKTN